MLVLGTGKGENKKAGNITENYYRSQGPPRDPEVLMMMTICMYIFMSERGFGGLEVACWPLVPKFMASNPAEAVGFFRAKKSSARLPSEGN